MIFLQTLFEVVGYRQQERAVSHPLLSLFHSLLAGAGAKELAKHRKELAAIKRGAVEHGV